MKADDILAQLRDIHLPAELDAAPTIEFVVWPFVVLAIAVSAILVARLWNRNRWRRRRETPDRLPPQLQSL